MNYALYAVYDEKAQCFNSPFALATDGLAVRGFQEACKDQRTDLCKYPGDYKLYKVALIDMVTCRIDGVVPPVLLCDNTSKE